MSGILWRILIAVIAVVLAVQLIPLVLTEIGFDISANLMKIVKLCIAGIAVFYILRGPNPSWSRP